LPGTFRHPRRTPGARPIPTPIQRARRPLPRLRELPAPARQGPVMLGRPEPRVAANAFAVAPVRDTVSLQSGQMREQRQLWTLATHDLYLCSVYPPAPSFQAAQAPMGAKAMTL